MSCPLYISAKSPVFQYCVAANNLTSQENCILACKFWVERRTTVEQGCSQVKPMLYPYFLSLQALEPLTSHNYHTHLWVQKQIDEFPLHLLKLKRVHTYMVSLSSVFLWLQFDIGKLLIYVFTSSMCLSDCVVRCKDNQTNKN